MHLLFGNMFDPASYTDDQGKFIAIKPNALVITTNGCVKSTGAGVMGRGCAKEAAEIFPYLPLSLGRLIRRIGNHVGVMLISADIHLISFPVKPESGICNPNKSNIVGHMKDKFEPGVMVPGWACKAELKLIKQSAIELRDLVNSKGWNKIIIPRPGCGAGELDWEHVRPILEKYLGDEFYCITYK